MQSPNFCEKFYCRHNFGTESDFQLSSPLITIKIDLNSQTEKLRYKTWSGEAFYGKISYKSLTFWKKCTAGTTLAWRVILRFLQKIAETTQKILKFQKKYFLQIMPSLYLIDGLSAIFFSNQPYGIQGL